MSYMRPIVLPMLFTILLCQPCASGAVQEFQNKVAWQSAAGPFTTIDFTGYPDDTLITNQYAAQGVTFTDGSDFIYLNQVFVNDGAGLYGAIESISVSFASPITAIAVDFPGSLAFRLYSGGSVVYVSNDFLHSGTGFFAGLVSEESFDSADIFGPTGNVDIDDLYFGPPIPAPGALGLLAVAVFAPRRRRRF